MKFILICFSMLLFGFVSQAQSRTAFLNITLTDLQSVSLMNPALNKISETRDGSQKGPLQILRSSSSQVKQIDSKTLEYEKLYKEFYSDEAAKSTSSGTENIYKLAATRPNKLLPNQNTSYLVIYQVDPR